MKNREDLKEPIFVSIIVPIYNVEEYLNECINSILHQSYKNLELILVDDGSPDNCGKLCDEYAKSYKNIKVIHRINEGLSSARNAGIDAAEGDYFAFVDSDDCIHPDYLQTLVALAVEYNADLTCCDYVQGENCVWKNLTKTTITVRNGDEVIDNMFINDTVITVVWNKLYKRDFFTKLKLRYPDGKIYEDMVLTPQILSHTKRMIITNKPLYFYRVRKDSITSSTFSLKKLDMIEGIEFRILFFKSIKKEKLYYLELEGYIRKLLRFYRIMRKEDKKIYYSELSSIKLKMYEIAKKHLFDKNFNFKYRIKTICFFLFKFCYE